MRSLTSVGKKMAFGRYTRKNLTLGSSFFVFKDKKIKKYTHLHNKNMRKKLQKALKHLADLMNL
ncbi:hypothetical protein N568_0105750 [Lactococcus garvieae TRF1]|uniref:Uncharacterized protein n=1 Tax=Lactococcus garvieae TRF1 TaxID=1380772 RepID=V8APN9_9LACT|nr:hypothetical protein N568_0105750 [Lactococcus garvieae TRF1]